MATLTKDAKSLLYHIYSEYKRRRASGSNKSDALMFGDYSATADLLMPGELPDDVNEYLSELHSAGYISALFGDNHIVAFALNNSAIVMMENLPKDILFSVASFTAKFIPI